MWRLKQFIPKEPAGLEGRVVDVGNVKVQVRNAIAEGGFSCVYLARDAVNPSKQYALKHMICNDAESLELVMKEISVMRLLKGHPNVVTLVAHTILDMGRMKEALLVMEFCEKSLVGVLDSRGAGYFDEKQVLLIFRDVCNAVFAMHSQLPPIAHRDLKAENILLGSDGAWKLCDFGSTSTNHKCFDRPEEMGIEEDNIRKHTTPAYRAPEMWDLFRREVISEKVDIWALGCLLFRICYFKSAFDGESKLQILNGNYRIPELPKFSSSITGLIKDMLEGSPDARPDITQVWFRVNQQLPMELQKHLPDGSTSAIDMRPPTSDMNSEGAKRSPLMPRRSPPPPPTCREQVRNISPQPEKDMHHSKSSQGTSKTVGGSSGGSMGSFWSSQFAQDPQLIEEKGPVFDEPPTDQMTKHNRNSLDSRVSPSREQHVRPGQPMCVDGNSRKTVDDKPSEDFEIRFFPGHSVHASEKTKPSQTESKENFQNEAFNTFVAEFDTTKFSSGSTASYVKNNGVGKEELEAEVNRLKEQLKQANVEKAEITSKYEKLSAICRSQRLEIQDLKRAMGPVSPAPTSKDNMKSHPSPASVQSSTPPREKIEGTVWELQQGMFTDGSTSPSPEPKPWQAFADEPKTQTTPNNISHSKSVRTTNSRHNSTKQPVSTPANNTWGFEQDSFTADPAAGSRISRSSTQGSSSHRFAAGETKKVAEANKPAGWAGF
ncbi:hypothetical protein J5N97_000735 [Dioscorea zingiberensis]|uniref:non-specific serine/threonine protein kinase n=1 Tax=Dioscorea zingiberensis TaxID=325984 RepID=A0A9D5H2V3_9LILI|nr:hypothetical protein J5N97_000735 [Dioscorea zingiberensis]